MKSGCAKSPPQDISKQTVENAKQVAGDVDCNAELAKKSRTCREEHFGLIKSAVRVDDDGFPSLEGIVRPEAETPHPMYDFQKNVILPNFLSTLSNNLYKQGLLWDFVFGNLMKLNVCCCNDAKQLLETGLSNQQFEEVFTARFGGLLLRGPEPGENTWGIQDAVICDTWPYLLDLDIKEKVWFEPCKIIFRQDGAGLHLEAIVTKKP